jgi:hypothetical protein
MEGLKGTPCILRKYSCFSSMAFCTASVHTSAHNSSTPMRHTGS